ncbi:probable F420-dependent oxidoreductase, MSMEG_4141 family [Actinopolymorpha cephalotaxi]|uniref:F420-dependent oxidoreductase n=1 Tax=Actinopolymorpha cephalotaxi TaxID=504797 RepID=A0A1I2RCZ0_9ACTN|nr:TIGR03620 family F420-dependent LLM class oxidoreductase [Actinopolymorpha cephalotaxi]NYH82285.1 putative F420-dependent oxidoreductase [Actinopolymorpha cephalotaxi]SFG37923.1 probable F420-dependent oxidoreductase, MSMEG_4141 family [Actinopolymorpha cephalotaxi]
MTPLSGNAPKPGTWKERLGAVGVWSSSLNWASAASAREAAAEIEELGYGSLWVSETPLSKEPFTNTAVLLAATARIPMGTGIANVWARDATAARAATLTLSEAFPGRFLLGLGVSHLPAVEARGGQYARPLAKMRDYLDQLEGGAPYEANRGTEDPPVVLAALRQKMLELARDRTQGAHPYFVPPEHTARAREVLGAGPLLIPEQAVLVETDPDKARALGREHTSYYLRLPNYTNNLRTLGFTDEDFGDGGSDRLVDAIVAWGDVDAVRTRVRAHLDAGADHVLLQAVAPEHGLGLDQLRELAPALLG